MATSVTSSFAGKATEFFVSSMIDSRTLSTAGITIDDSVEYKYIPRGFAMSNIVQTGVTCSWDDGGTTTISEDPKELKGFYVNKTECFSDYASNHFDASSTDLPGEVQDKISEVVSSTIASDREALLWKGAIVPGTGATSGCTASLYDGYCAILNGSAVEISGVTLSSSNIAAQLARVYNAMPAGIKLKDPSKLVIFCSINAEGLYRQALATQGVNTTADDYTPKYLGIEVRGVDLFSDTMVAGLRESFHFASNTGVDSAVVNLKNMYPVTLEQNARVQAAWKEVVAVTNKDQVVLYNF